MKFLEIRREKHQDVNMKHEEEKSSVCFYQWKRKKKDKTSRFISNMVNHRDAMQQIKAVRVVRGYDFPEKNVCYNHN